MNDYEISVSKYNELVALVERKIIEQEQLSKMYIKVAELLKCYEGKVINVRIEKAIKLEGYKIRYSKYHESPQLYIYKDIEDGEYSRRVESYKIYIAEKGQQRFTTKTLLDKAKEKQEKAQKDRLKAQDIITIVNTYNNALLCLNKARNDLTKIPYYYDLSIYN